MEQREIGQKDILIADLRQSQGAREALEDQVAMGVLDALRGSRGARRVHHGRQVVDSNRVTPLLDQGAGDPVPSRLE